jgi:hypothetical protein
MKTKKQVEEKIKEIKEKIKTAPTDPGQSFSYWVGQLRAFEWYMDKEGKK